jgi:hypothetical protein
VTFAIYAPTVRSPNVRAAQIHLSVSRHGRRGPFVPVALTGSTVNDAEIIGVIGGELGLELRARHTITLTYRIEVSTSVPRRRRKPILEFQALLEQLNPASGTDSVLGETHPKNVRVR